MGKVVAAIVVIVILILGYVFLFDTDTETTGEFSAPEIEVETRGEFDVPETEVDVEGPDITTGEEEITVPTVGIDPAEEGEADADAPEEDEPQR